MPYRLFHGKPLKFRLFTRDNDVDIILAAQAVIGHRQERVGVGWKVDSHNVGLLIHYVIDETGILMAETVVILPPHVRAQEVIERGDRAAPRNVAANLQPFRVLVEHGIDNVNEGLVA